MIFTPRIAAAIALAGVVLSGTPLRLLAQHDEHMSMPAMSADTLASAPTTPTRSVADSAFVGDSVLRICKPHIAHFADAYATCIGDALAALSAAGNIALAMGTLDWVEHRNPALILLGHPLAHALGYAVRSTPKTATALLSECDDRYQSGCYHGILQRYFDVRIGMPLANAVLLAPCDGLRGTNQQFRIFDCLHGTGHGLMMYHRYDVNASLADCDRLRTPWDQNSCYGGVFMEHNMGARMKFFGDGNLGMHSHAMPAANVVLFKPDDLQYPCDATPERYRVECYELQPDLILPAVQEDYRKASVVCDAAGTPRLVASCYSGLGRNASGASAFQFAGIRRRCDLASPYGKPFCYQGAVRHLAYAPSELPRGVAFCKSLPEGETRARCWDGIGLQVSGFFADIASRQKACQSDLPGDVAACLEGAGAEQAAGSRNRP
ncbi:MAG TPA: hypothetical protein VHL32_06540 [Gemmatimonadaceae bacterium]|jgi:hypothetical protein|nr:hypothetical protein [Gemmatimonadaceae bacterium]